MKKLIIFVSLVCSMLLTSCDSDGDNSTKDSNGVVMLETNGRVVRKGPSGFQSGDIAYFLLSNDAIIVFTYDTLATRQDASCGQAFAVPPSEINIGDTISARYLMDDVDFASEPDIIRAKIVEAYRAECLNGQLFPLTDQPGDDAFFGLD